MFSNNSSLSEKDENIMQNDNIIYKVISKGMNIIVKFFKIKFR
jgi:hypothetical protein